MPVGTCLSFGIQPKFLAPGDLQAKSSKTCDEQQGSDPALLTVGRGSQIVDKKNELQKSVCAWFLRGYQVPP